jgi:tetratricopeptide (TPR) repeat protein
METFSVVIVFAFFLWIAILLGLHKTRSMKDMVKYKKILELIVARSYAEAIVDIDQSLKKDINSPILWFYRSVSNFELDNLYQAISDSIKATNLDYNLKDCYLIKGRSLYSLSHYDEAILAFNLAIWHFKNSRPDVYRYRGLCYYELGENLLAEKDFIIAAQLKDEEANYYLYQMRSKLPILKS